MAPDEYKTFVQTLADRALGYAPGVWMTEAKGAAMLGNDAWFRECLAKAEIAQAEIARRRATPSQ